VKSSAACAALAMGLMLSPESFVRLGNSLGDSGAYFIAALVVAAFLQIITAMRLGNALALFPPGVGEIMILETGLGKWPAVLLGICSRVVTAVCLSTAVLATAGFVFNEVFLLWFPNFAFAFFLLAFLVLANLFSPTTAKMLQVVFVVLSLGGVVILSVAHFATSASASVVPQPGSVSVDWRIPFSAVFLFVGFDLAGFAPNGKPDSPLSLTAGMVAGIGIAALALSAWGLASSAVVPLSKLKETTIPHMIAARQILGEQGRWIMGFAVLAGTCAAVNALVMAAARMSAAMSERGLLPGILAGDHGRATVPVMLMGTGIALMLATGMAGEPQLEICVRAGLLYWLLQYAGFHYSLLNVEKPELAGLNSRLGHSALFLLSAFALLFYVFIFLVLVWADPDRTTLLCFMSAVGGSVAVFYGAVCVAAKMKR
jgi:amino acid transporter